MHRVRRHQATCHPLLKVGHIRTIRTICGLKPSRWVLLDVLRHISLTPHTVHFNERYMLVSSDRPVHAGLFHKSHIRVPVSIRPL